MNIHQTPTGRERLVKAVLRGQTLAAATRASY
jgi:hypothetical protein